MNTFDLTILTSTKVLFKGTTTYCGATTITGSIGFKANHEPFIGVLKAGSTICYRSGDGSMKNIASADGMLTFKDNLCTVIISIPEQS